MYTMVMVMVLMVVMVVVVVVVVVMVVMWVMVVVCMSVLLPNPCLWQSSLHVDSAAHSANSVGLRYPSHWQSSSPLDLVTQVPSFCPMELQVVEQKLSPRWQREGRRARRLLRLMLFSLQWQSPASLQKPLVCPRVTQLAVHAHVPREHLKPARAGLVRARRRRSAWELVMAGGGEGLDCWSAGATGTMERRWSVVGPM